MSKYIDSINFAHEVVLLMYRVVFTNADTGEHETQLFLSDKPLTISDVVVERYGNIYVEVDTRGRIDAWVYLSIRHEHFVSLELMRSEIVVEFAPEYKEINDALRAGNPVGATAVLKRFKPDMHLKACKEWVEDYYPIAFPEEYARYAENLTGNGDEEDYSLYDDEHYKPWYFSYSHRALDREDDDNCEDD